MESLQITKNAEWQSPISKWYLLYDFLYITLFNNHRDKEQMSGCQTFGMGVGQGCSYKSLARRSFVAMEPFCIFIAVVVTQSYTCVKTAQNYNTHMECMYI